MPPYDKGSAIATLTAVMTEPVEQPKNAGPLESVIYGLLAKDPEQRLDDAGARALLNEVLREPEPKAAEPEPMDATKVVTLPPVPEEGLGRRSSGSGTGSGARKGEEASERLRGALRSVRKAASAAGAATAAATTRAKAPGGSAEIPGARSAAGTADQGKDKSKEKGKGGSAGCRLRWGRCR